MTKSILDDAYKHHIWATERILNACSGLSAAQLNAPCLGTYGSILDTLRHTVESDRWYAKRFPTGEHLPGIEDDNQMTFAEMRMAMDANGEAWLKLLETDLDHRSQICTALTSIGIEPPEIDVWAYADAAGRQWDVPAPTT
jgi:uncharacterized damage-inducible protein DinB